MDTASTSNITLDECTTTGVSIPDLSGFRSPVFESAGVTFRPYVRLHGSQNPFWKIYECVKTVFGVLILLPIRILLLVIASVLCYIFAKIALLGIDQYDEQYVFQELSLWRLMCLMMLRPLVRVILFSLGFLWIKQSKQTWQQLPKIPEQTPPQRMQYDKPFVVLSNHLGYVDILILLTKYGGAFVAKEGIAKVPFIGIVARALQTMFLQKGKPLTESLVLRVRKTYELHAKYSGIGPMTTKVAESEACTNLSSIEQTDTKHIGCGSCLSKLVIFPEGTTTNGTGMVKFRSGIFIAGMPVQLVAIKLPFKHFSLSWESIYFREHLFRSMTQIFNTAELIELPVYSPSKKEIENPKLFGENVQLLFASALDTSIYPLNKKHKGIYHRYLLNKITEEEALMEAKEVTEQDLSLTSVSRHNFH